jgi:membrane-bound ClpP family serine protease
MLIFVAIAVGAFIIVAGAFLFGHDVDHDVSHDFGHDADSGGGTVSIFSMKVMGTMLMGFGAAGAIARLYGFGYLTSSIIGVAFGVVLAAMMFGLSELIGRQQASSVSSAKNFIGSVGQVTVSIDADGVGEVGVSRGGQYVNYPARSRNGKAIPKGRQVKVVGATGANLTVEEIVNE